MIFYAMYIIPTTLVEKHIEHLNVDDTIVQNYTMAKNINDGLVKEQVITFTKRDDAWYDKNEFVSFVQPLKDQVKFIVVANNDTVVQLQHTDGDVVKVTKEKYPKLTSKGRPLNSKYDTPNYTSIETYLKGELSSYSIKTLKLYYESSQSHQYRLPL